MNATARKPGWIVTFYSYKGGVGRSFLLANVAAALAKWGLRVLCIDWDLEAPGLHAYFIRGGPPPSRGLAHLVAAFRQGGAFEVADWITRVPIGDRELHLLAAGHGDPAYPRIVQDLDWAQLYTEGLGEALECAREAWRRDYDIVLVDSRTGFADTSGICTIQLPDCLVAVASATEQSLQGLRQVLGHVHHQRSESEVERPRLVVVPVLNRFDGATELKLGEEWVQRFVDTFRDELASWMHHELKPEEIAASLRVPQIAYWNFGERLAVLESAGADPTSINWSIHNLAALLEQRLAGSHDLVKDRDAYVRESERRRTPFERDVLIVPLAEDAPADEVRGHLSGAGRKVEVVRQPDSDTVARSQHVVLVQGTEGRAPDRVAASVVRAFFAPHDDGHTRRMVVVGDTPGGDSSLASLRTLGAAQSDALREELGFAAEGVALEVAWVSAPPPLDDLEGYEVVRLSRGRARFEHATRAPRSFDLARVILKRDQNNTDWYNDNWHDDPFGEVYADRYAVDTLHLDLRDPTGVVHTIGASVTLPTTTVHDSIRRARQLHDLVGVQLPAWARVTKL